MKTRVIALLLCLCMVLSVVPASALANQVDGTVAAAEAVTPTTDEKLYDTSVSGEYFKVISANTYDLAPGAMEHEIVLNNADGNDRKVAHVFEVDTKNEDLEVMPGYYGIDKLNPDDLSDRTHWTDKQLSQTVKYYEDELGYNVVGAMNTALAYDSNAPYGYMVWNGVVLGTPAIHKGAQTYLAIDWDGNVELRSMSTPLTGNEKTAIPANFGWLVKDGKLSSTNVERTSSDASRSMVGVKADGTLIFCLVDGRNGAISSGLSNYEMGEMMLALGCVNAFNGDGGGSSTFISKRAGESVNTMRSVPSDGSERATINSVILVSTAGATGIFDKALIATGYDYIAPTASMPFSVTGLDTKNFTMDVPAEVTYQVKEAGAGTLANGIFTAGAATGTATIQAVYNGEVVGEKVLNIVHPNAFGFTAETTALPMDKTLALELMATYGADDWNVCIDGAYTLSLPEENLGSSLNGNVMAPPADPAMEMKTVIVTATYNPDPSKKDTISVMFGDATKVVFDFEDGDVSDFMGIDEMLDWAAKTGAPAKITADGNFSDDTDAEAFLATADNGQVKNGNYALGVTLDYTDAQFASWAYNMFFYTGEQVVLRDVANGMNATTFGMWVYIPEGAAGLAMQIQGTKVRGDVSSGTGAHFYFKTVSGAVKNLNSCTEADIPESRWVYATVDLTQFGDYFATYDPMATNSRSPSFIRYYVKPQAPAKLTFYFDDFSLDYSSAVEDRVLPTITNVTYATQDTGIELAEGIKIDQNTMTFAANVADNQMLDAASGKILVDGIAVGASVAGKSLASDTVTLTSGVHTVTFEIKDKLGNLARVTRTFTVSGNAAFSLDGHNESGTLAEYGSVYYADIKAADIAKLNSLTATIKLQTANTWEPQGMMVADGFTATYELDELANEVTVNVTKTGTVGESDILVSVPMRMWTWNGSNHVTDTPITSEDQFKTGYCPIVKIECDITYGKAELSNGTAATFGGTFNTDTKMNDNLNPWHYHDAELTVLNKEATCSEAGYANRTYCETCKSVVDWGTKVEATGHNYAITNNKLACNCGETLDASGLITVNDKVYCMIAGNLMSGWQSAGNEGSVTKWCYADPTTMEVYTGKFTVNGLTYTADENGVLTSGVWVENYLGRRYSYGPGFYAKQWATIDGVDYYFGSNTYAFTGYHQIRDNENNKKTPYRWFLFGKDGALVDNMKDYYGFLDVNGVKYFLEGGIGNTYIGTTKIDDNGRVSDNGSYYYLDDAGKVMTGKQWVGSYLQSFSKYPLPTGNYEFDDNGKMLDGVITKEDGTYYYKMGKPVDSGWTKINNDYYVFTNGGKALTGRNWVGTYLNQTSKDPYKVGNFIFAQDGKLANGVVEADDGWYYCAAGVGQEAGLIKIDGTFYYADVNGKLATGRIWVGTYSSHGLLPKGYYEFGADGKMLSGVVAKEDGTYYYEMGRPVDTGWLKVGNDYYVFTNGGKALTGANWVGSHLTQTSRNPYRKGNFFFTQDGKLANGVANGYYYQNGVAKYAGLVLIGDDYYLAEADGKLMTGRIWVGTYASNGLLPKGYYEFGADGAMLQGVVEKDDGLYYYNLGNTRYLGLIKRDGEYYYVNEGGKLETGRVYVGTHASNGLVSKGHYEFGADGAMLNGFELLSDGLYYYNKGVARYYGLKVIGDDLYYIEEGGKVMTGRVYVGTYASNGLLPKGNYTFAADGKFVG